MKFFLNVYKTEEKELTATFHATEEYARLIAYDEPGLVAIALPLDVPIPAPTEPAAPERLLARNQPCGCVVCSCDAPCCFGCGARHCGTHRVGQIPNPVYEPTAPAPQPEASECVWSPPEDVISGWWITGCGERRYYCEIGNRFCAICGKPIRIEGSKP